MCPAQRQFTVPQLSPCPLPLLCADKVGHVLSGSGLEGAPHSPVHHVQGLVQIELDRGFPQDLSVQHPLPTTVPAHEQDIKPLASFLATSKAETQSFACPSFFLSCLLYYYSRGVRVAREEGLERHKILNF